MTFENIVSDSELQHTLRQCEVIIPVCEQFLANDTSDAMFVDNEIKIVHQAWLQSIRTNNIVEMNGLSVADTIFMTRCLLNCCLSRAHRLDCSIQQLKAMFVEIAIFASNHKIHFMKQYDQTTVLMLFHRVAAFIVQHFYNGHTALSIEAEHIQVSHGFDACILICCSVQTLTYSRTGYF